jgi:hypothetical protein
MSNSVTVSEAKFEEFLRTHGLPSERVVEAGTPRPDYRVTVGKLLLMFEVKELSKDDNFRHGQFAVSSRTVGDHIRSKVKRARPQGKFGADRGIPSIMLVYNALDPMHLFGTENHDFIDAMYGERTLGIQMATGQVLDDFQGRNKSFSQNKSAYFSALGRLMPRNGEMTVTLFENMFAAVPIPYEALPPCFEVIRFEPEKAP